MEALRVCDAFWKCSSYYSVLGEDWSWAETILAGRELIRRANWTGLQKEEVNVLLGRDSKGAWGLLGSMRGAASAVGQFLANTGNVRRTIQKAIVPVTYATSEAEFVDAAINAIQDISSLNRFGPAIATRFIALAAPHRGVSVNRGSAPGLARATGLPEATLVSGRNYRELLAWVYSRPWYSTPEPHASLDRAAWSMRAALLDSFVYRAV
jgi:hypothetical protein